MAGVINRALFSSASDHWATPQELYQALNDEFDFDFDPCPLRNVPCPLFPNDQHHIDTGDGLVIDWGECTFVNPPYSEIDKWCEKAVREYKKGKTVVMLIPSRTDTKYWHKYIMQATEIRFCRGRLKFNGAKHNAPFPSAVIVFTDWLANEKEGD